MTEPLSPSSADLAARMLAAYQQGDIATVLALGEPLASMDDADGTALLLLGAARAWLFRVLHALKHGALSHAHFSGGNA